MGSMGEANLNYKGFINALMVFDAAVTGHTKKFDFKGLKVSKRDVAILKRLIRHRVSPNQFPKYVNELFTALTASKRYIKIHLTDISTKRQTLKPLLCCDDDDELAAFGELFRLFPNCSRIALSYSFDAMPTCSASFLEAVMKKIIDIDSCEKDMAWQKELRFQFVRYDAVFEEY